VVECTIIPAMSFRGGVQSLRAALAITSGVKMSDIALISVLKCAGTASYKAVN
jgi:hypothetical protein